MARAASPSPESQAVIADAPIRNSTITNRHVGETKEFEMDWNENRAHLLGNVGKLGALTPDTVKGYMTASGAGNKTGHLDEKTRQLISLAVAVTTRCDGCISIHSNEASKAGASREELAEALGVAIAMNAGAALVYSTRALEAFDAAPGA
ncbi:carboxymuconolactone decarboxylase family protein [Sphingobium ummariense]